MRPPSPSPSRRLEAAAPSRAFAGSKRRALYSVAGGGLLFFIIPPFSCLPSSCFSLSLVYPNSLISSIPSSSPSFLLPPHSSIHLPPPLSPPPTPPLTPLHPPSSDAKPPLTGSSGEVMSDGGPSRGARRLRRAAHILPPYPSIPINTHPSLLFLHFPHYPHSPPTFPLSLLPVPLSPIPHHRFLSPPPTLIHRFLSPIPLSLLPHSPSLPPFLPIFSLPISPSPYFPSPCHPFPSLHPSLHSLLPITPLLLIPPESTKSFTRVRVYDAPRLAESDSRLVNFVHNGGPIRCHGVACKLFSSFSLSVSAPLRCSPPSPPILPLLSFPPWFAPPPLLSLLHVIAPPVPFLSSLVYVPLPLPPFLFPLFSPWFYGSPLYSLSSPCFTSRLSCSLPLVASRLASSYCSSSPCFTASPPPLLPFLSFCSLPFSCFTSRLLLFFSFLLASRLASSSYLSTLLYVSPLLFSPPFASRSPPPVLFFLLASRFASSSSSFPPPLPLSLPFSLFTFASPVFSPLLASRLTPPLLLLSPCFIVRLSPSSSSSSSSFPSFLLASRLASSALPLLASRLPPPVFLPPCSRLPSSSSPPPPLSLPFSLLHVSPPPPSSPCFTSLTSLLFIFLSPCFTLPPPPPLPPPPLFPFPIISLLGRASSSILYSLPFSLVYGSLPHTSLPPLLQGSPSSILPPPCFTSPSSSSLSLPFLLASTSRLSPVLFLSLGFTFLPPRFTILLSSLQFSPPPPPFCFTSPSSTSFPYSPSSFVLISDHPFPISPPYPFSLASIDTLPSPLLHPISPPSLSLIYPALPSPLPPPSL
ncbi:hypothetical protein C7M84_005951 [Penaeus vannamei]|uniref:Uncharacterized protein n=1 Tax=Penaeus vannamei TaxID=6689 RepID=A0A3R7QDT6_PENVA|nr:hypothetical protein C7M84_005951 [Penaeus vannamei]